ncbi:hypothetical protein KH5H1_09420 [Corallococcus caeni]|uniref:Uncharacterized protein n=1 Tax=Corallococcus caeni TaxID=3082388 RepID=A0ABQ6QXX5_9BACT|nr:hypothetical protein KH5H1_09420 [Corallococcus sp. KH5-1]GMU08646.1 hypothetical protein ASNO1_48990 [Corallococcus sp. NO1]
MILLKAALILALTSANPEAAPAKAGASAGCATTNIEVALRHLFERYKDGGTLDVARDSGEPITPQFIAESLKVRDVPNGYALVESPDLIETYEAALFKNPNGYHLVVVSSGASVSRTAVFKCDADGLKADNTALQLSDADAIQLYADAGLLKANAKKGLSEKTLKDWAGSIVTLGLPRKGRVITIKANVDEPAGVYGKKLGTVDYVDGRFVVSSLAKKAR